MHRILKLYDTAPGFVLGIAVTLLAEGHHNEAMAVALIGVGLRFTIGRAADAALHPKDPRRCLTRS